MAHKSSPLQRLHDILDAIERIDRYAATRKEADQSQSDMLFDAVVRNIEIVSEATRHIPAELTSEYPDTPWRAIADIGNILRHGYDRIRQDIIWRTVEDDLPSLKRIIAELIEKLTTEPN